VVEGTGLENRHTGEPGIESSNLSLSVARQKAKGPKDRGPFFLQSDVQLPVENVDLAAGIDVDGNHLVYRHAGPSECRQHGLIGLERVTQRRDLSGILCNRSGEKKGPDLWGPLRCQVTDRERFELSIPGSPVCRFSRPVPSTTRPPVRDSLEA
jgi:hypothetical protein